MPLRTLAELLRVAYFESLRREGLSHARIAAQLGQSERHVRSYEKRLRGDFFAAEREVGLVREVEDFIAANRPKRTQVERRFSTFDPAEVRGAVDALVAEHRVVESAHGRLASSNRYVLLKTPRFHQRIDALNHFLDGVYAAVLHRLVHDERDNAMIKSVSFTALPKELQAYSSQLEQQLRVEIERLEQSAAAAGSGRRFTLGLSLASQEEPRRVTRPLRAERAAAQGLVRKS